MKKVAPIKTIALFDFDGTITSSDSWNDFYVYYLGIWQFFCRIVPKLGIIGLYKLGLATNQAAKEALLTDIFPGMAEADFQTLAKKYAVKRMPQIINPEAVARIQWHQKQGHEVVILTASLAEWIEPWARKIGITKVIASQLEIKKNQLTGKLTVNCHGAQKTASFLEDYPDRSKYVLYAYGDSRHDKRILALADYGFYRSFTRQNYQHWVVVTDGLWRKSLAVIRAMGKAGYKVTTLGDSWFTTGFWSRYTSQRVLGPVAAQSAEKFGQTLLQTVKHLPSKPVLFPMEDASLLWCVRNEAKLAQYVDFLFPPLPALEIAEDKAQTIQLAHRLGLPVPQTFYPRTLAAFMAILKKLPSSNFIVKPVSASGSAGLVYLEMQPDKDWKKHWLSYGPLIVQERINGQGKALGVSLLFDQQSVCKATFVHQRLQQYPNTGGPSTDRISVYDKQLVKLSIKLLTHLHWQGIAMVEWKANPMTQSPVLMEINPRFWGSLELAIRAGVNFPLLYTRAAKGESLPDPPTYSEGVRCRWLIPGEVLRYLTQPKALKESFLAFLKGLPNMAEEWDRTDLLGFLSTLVCTAALACNPRYWKYVKRG